MQSAIIYYSYSGNTRGVADLLSVILAEQGTVNIIEIKGLDESDKFLVQAARAFRHKRCEIQPAEFDLSPYDLICIGTPVWAFAPAPAVNACIDKCFGLAGKEMVLFTTYGSGAGKERCIDYMQEILTNKGAKNFKRFAIQQFKVKDKDFVISAIKSALAL